MYLSPEAADAALLCARSLSSAPGSQLALTLQTRAPPALGWRRWCRPAGWWGAARPLRRLLLSPWRLAFRAMAAAAGERLRFFFSGPDEAAAWLAQRGFAARWVRDYATLAAGLGVDAAAAPGFALHVASRELAGEVPHIALADRV